MCVCVCVCVCVYDGLSRQSRLMSTQQDINFWTAYTDDSFIKVKISVEPATLLWSADHRRMVKQCA